MSAVQKVSTKVVALGIFAVALILAGLVSFYASGSPDGLTKVSQEKGFAATETAHHTADSPFAGYSSSFVDDNDRLSGGLAGVVGVLVVLGLGTGVAFSIRRRNTGEEAESAAVTTAV